jgi:glycogen phosphorylase
MPRIRSANPRRFAHDADNAFARLVALAHNLWWTWNVDAQRLFAALDPPQWETTGHNPLRTLAALSPERRAFLQHDAGFLALLRACEQQLANYLHTPTWFQRTATAPQKRLLVAYFCAEFGLHESLPIYAGGLGILAGDHLKSASDLGIPLVAVGLLYRNGYYRQALRSDGTTRPVYSHHDFTQLPIQDTGRVVAIPLGRRTVRARLWHAQIGRVPLYLLDTDLPKNSPRDRAITARLYGGDQETRIQQEIVLGMGGVRALDALGIHPTVFHLNEGHAAFCTLERLRMFRKASHGLSSAIARVATSTVFTTHTPVAAGHDRFPPALMMKYFAPRLPEIGLVREGLLGLGRVNPRDRREPFCMTILALLLSRQANAVSEIHGSVSREMWQSVFDTRDPDNVPIGHVTNGIHAETWLAPEMRPLYDRYLRPRWVGAAPTDDCWKKAGRIPPPELWRARNVLRSNLVAFARQRLEQQVLERCGPESARLAARAALDEHAMTIGFARRFATYKRATLIFHDIQRLAAILNNPRRPVQLIFAGKAHPADAAGQKLAQRIFQFAQRPEFRGRIVLLENYDMHVARLLTAGCDVWLNNPLPPQEASGTSGMKPPLHGGLNCSILDGWWPEVCNGRNGWAIGTDHPQSRGRTQDRRDAASLYQLLEDEIVPLFYERDRHGLPHAWVRRMQASLQTICGRFNTHRMLAEYLALYNSALQLTPPAAPLVARLRRD